MGARISCLFFAFLIVSPAQAEEFWEKKDYRRWSERECRKLLENSPWGKRHTLTSVHIDLLQRNPVSTIEGPTPADPSTRAWQTNPRMEYVVQLRSALLVRQALVRLAQIEQGYDKMSSKRREAFDQQANQFLDTSFPGIIIVHVAYRSNVQDYDRALAHYWKTQTTDLLRNFVFLIGPRGEKVPLLQYVVGEGARREFQFVFPREFEGRPLVGPGDKSLKLEFAHPNIGGQGDSRVLLEFKVEKMQLGEGVVY